MKFVCIEPLINSGNLIAFTSFSEQGEFQIHTITEPEKFDHFLDSKKFFHICFNVFKSFPVFRDKLEFLWDVKILYELLGYKFDGFIHLGTMIFSSERMEKYVKLNECVLAHIKSYRESKINVNGYQFVQLLPETLVTDLYLERAKVVVDLFLKVLEQDKKFYIKFYDVIKMLDKISSKPIKIDLSAIESDNTHYANKIRKNTKNGIAILKFKAVGAKTGRLGFVKNSLNIYNLPKSFRNCIIPSDGKQFVEIDFKASQPRIAIACTEDEQFIQSMKNIEDIYSIFPGDRNKVKIGFLAWMFGRKRVPDSVYEKYAWPIWQFRDGISKISNNQGFLDTRFGRRLYNHGEEKHIIFQNFITATEADFIFKLCCDLIKCGCDLVFPFHDAIIFEIEDVEEVSKYKIMCEQSFKKEFGLIGPVDVKIGKNFGDMNPLSSC